MIFHCAEKILSVLILCIVISGITLFLPISLFFGQTEFYVFAEHRPEKGPTILDQDYVVEQFVTGHGFPQGLESPITISFLDDNMLVLQKNDGKVKHVKYNGLLVTEPVLDLEVFSEVEAGLLGIESIDSDVYLSFTESADDKGSPERYVIIRYSWNGTKLISPHLVKDLNPPILWFTYGWSNGYWIG